MGADQIAPGRQHQQDRHVDHVVIKRGRRVGQPDAPLGQRGTARSIDSHPAEEQATI